jgi:hypothetical protein
MAERTVRTIKDGLKKKLAGSMDRWCEALPGISFAINTKDHALTKTAPFTLFFGRSAAPWEDYSVQELALRHDPAEGRIEVELQQKDVQQIVDRRAEFEKLVRTPIQEAANERQNTTNAQLIKRRKTVEDRTIRPGTLVYVIDQERSSKWEPKYVGPFLVHRQSKRSKTFYLDNFQGQRIPKPFPVQHLIFIRDTNLPITNEDGSATISEQSKPKIRAILKDRPAKNGLTEYLVSFSEEGKGDEWMKASFFDQSGMHRDAHRQPKPFTKRKSMPRKAKKKKLYYGK